MWLILLVLCLQLGNFFQTTGVRVMVMCPGLTVSEIIPDDQQELRALLYKDSWTDEFYSLKKRHEPPQK
jgi:short-subunit dehydrogenase